MSLFPLGLISQGGGAGGGGAFELISTAYGTGSSNSITFSSIPSSFTHLQIRMVGIATTNGGDYFYIRINGDTGTNYDGNHYLKGDGSTVTSAFGGASTDKVLISPDGLPGITTLPYAAIIDIADYANVNKFKTLRVLGGTESGSNGKSVSLVSGLWRSTSAITSLTLSLRSATPYWATSARFSLYGVKGTA